MKPKTKAGINLAVNCGIAACGTMLAAIQPDSPASDLLRVYVGLGVALNVLGVFRAAFGPSPATGE